MADANSRNKYDRKDSLELGSRAESLFVNLAKHLGWSVAPSSKDENIDGHWDYLIEKEGAAFRVEVKSSKRISRDDDGTQSDLTWIELHGVRPNDPGWLFGKADLIAFEKENSFLLVRKPDLLDMVNKKVNLGARVSRPGDALYKIYTRPGRRDKLTLLPMHDVDAIKFDEWKK